MFDVTNCKSILLKTLGLLWWKPVHYEHIKEENCAVAGKSHDAAVNFDTECAGSFFCFVWYFYWQFYTVAKIEYTTFVNKFHKSVPQKTLNLCYIKVIHFGTIDYDTSYMTLYRQSIVTFDVSPFQRYYSFCAYILIKQQNKVLCHSLFMSQHMYKLQFFTVFHLCNIAVVVCRGDYL